MRIKIASIWLTTLLLICSYNFVLINENSISLEISSATDPAVASVDDIQIHYEIPGGTIAEAEKEWTLLFHMAGDGNNEAIAIDDINALERGINTTNYNVVVQIDRIAGGDSSNGDWTTCRRYLIQPDTNSDRTIRSTMIQDIGEVNVGDPQVISNFLIWGIQNYTAKRYAIILWGGAVPNGFGGDATSGDGVRSLFGEHTEILEKTTKAIGRRIDFLSIWGCNYGMFENDFTIKEYTDYTARSEIPTWNMEGAATDFLVWLNGNYTNSTRDFSTAWVDSYMDYAESKGRCAGWCAIDLGPGMIKLNLAVDTFARELIKAGGINQTNISAAKNASVKCRDLAFDMNHFAKNINNTPSLPQRLRDAAQGVIDAYGYPPVIGKPLIDFRFIEGFRASNEVWPEPKSSCSELRGMKIRNITYSDMPSTDPSDVVGKPRYGPVYANNAWPWFLAGETGLPIQPLLTFESNSLDDTVPAYGTSVSFNVTLRNSGGATGTGITSVISTDDSNVTITQASSAFPNIASEANATSNSNFTITVNSGLPNGHRIWFWLNVTANGGVWQNLTSFCLEVLTPPNPYPIADAGPDQIVDQNTLVTFDGTGSWDNEMIVKYTWTFIYNGNPVSLNGISPSFTFETPGTYNITLEVLNNCSQMDTDIMNITVLDTSAPIANAGQNQTVPQGTIVYFNGSGSVDNVCITNYTWSFDDDGLQTISGMLTNYTFNNIGSFEVTLNVSDGAGLWDTDSITVTVKDITDPIANAGPDKVVDQREIVSFNASGSSDNIAIVNYTWTFEDDGLHELFGISPEYIFTDVGVFTVNLNVSDDSGNWDNDDLSVTVKDITDPIANAGPDSIIDQHLEVIFDGSGSLDNVAVTNFTWTFSYNDTEVILYGIVAKFIFDIVGYYPVTLTVYDAGGNSGSDSLNITVLDITKPIADAGEDIAIDVNTKVNFDGSGSYDNVGIDNYNWSFDHNGTLVELTGVNPNFMFVQEGIYTIQLKVEDKAGNYGMDDVLVSVIATGNDTVNETDDIINDDVVDDEIDDDEIDDDNDTYDDNILDDDTAVDNDTTPDNDTKSQNSNNLFYIVIGIMVLILVCLIALFVIRRRDLTEEEPIKSTRNLDDEPQIEAEPSETEE